MPKRKKNNPTNHIKSKKQIKTNIEEFEEKEKELRLKEIDDELKKDNPNTDIEKFKQPNSKVKKRNFKIIAFYAEKGGVGKTSNSYTLAYVLSQKYRVLLYDCDSQRSLSAFLLGLNYQNSIENYEIENPLTDYINKNGGDSSVKHSLYEQIMDEDDTNVKEAYAFFIKKNLWLVAGHRETSKLDSEIFKAEIFTDPSFPHVSKNNKTGKVYASIAKTAEKYNIEYVLLDLSPSNGVLNRCLVCSSHYLILSTICDFHCAETMNTMSETLKEWKERITKLREIENGHISRKSMFPIPEHTVKFLGYIVNRIDSTNIGDIKNGIEDNSQGYRRVEKCWLDRIEKAANRVNKLKDNNPPLAIRTDIYENLNRTIKIGEVREFWSFKNISDIVHLPVPFLLERHMIQYENDHISSNKKLDYNKIRKFREIFEEISKTIVNLIEKDNIKFV